MGRLLVPLGGGGGASSDECTVIANDILKGKTTITKDSDDEIVEGTLELTGNAEDKYVAKGKTYYNVDAHEKRTGSLELTGNAQVAHVPKGETFYTTDTQTKLTGTATSKAAETYYVTTSDQTIAAGQYLNGAQKISKITASGLTGGNILSGATITIHNGKSNVWSVAGTIPKLAGGTYTPSTSAQTIYCKGKYMTEDITFNGIPSNYVNPSTGAAFFENGSYGPMADLGAYYFHQDTKTGIITKTYLSASQLSSKLEIWTSTTTGSYQWVVFRRGFNSGTFKRFHVEYEVLSGKKTMFMFISKTTDSSGTSPIRLKRTGVGTYNGDYTLPDSNVNYCIGFANAVYASSGGVHNFKINKIIAYAS